VISSVSLGGVKGAFLQLTKRTVAMMRSDAKIFDVFIMVFIFL